MLLLVSVNKGSGCVHLRVVVVCVLFSVNKGSGCAVDGTTSMPTVLMRQHCDHEEGDSTSDKEQHNEQDE